MEGGGQTVISDSSKWLVRLASILQISAAFAVLVLASRQGISCFSSAHVDWLAPALLFGGASLVLHRADILQMKLTIIV